MARPSKEEAIAFLFYDQPNRRWRFKEIVKAVGIAESKVDKWLKKLLEEKMIKRVKKKREMPYYIAHEENPVYRQRKRIAGLQLLERSGLLAHLASLKAEVVILFGSFAWGDWHSRSDVDLFVYGAEEPDLDRFEPALRRELQIFAAKDRKSLGKLGANLMRNIIRGIQISGYTPQEVFDATQEPAGDVCEVQTGSAPLPAGRDRQGQDRGDALAGRRGS